MNNKTLLYDISDKVPFPKILIYAIQQCLSIFVATILIATICGTPIDACLIGACLGTLTYQLITGFRSPMFISSCGATVSAVVGALAIGEGNNYFAVFLGGLMVVLVYGVFSILISKLGIDKLRKVLPATIIGPITIVIGLNLAKFIPTYVGQSGGASGNAGVLVAIFTMLVVAVSSHYFKGFWKTIPFLIGLGAGYVVSLVLTLLGVAPLVNLSVFENLTIFRLPDFSFLHWSIEGMTVADVGTVALLFVPVSICAICEHWADHLTLSHIIGTDLTKTPGLDRTLLGDGIASCVGTAICGLPNTSYGESIATTGFSRVASTRVITVAAIITGLLAFLSPVQALIASIPSCVFGGCAMILYGFIAASGLKTLIRAKTDLEDNKNLIVVCAILTIGVSGIYLFSESFAGVSLAMVIGVVLNLILKNQKEKKDVK